MRMRGHMLRFYGTHNLYWKQVTEKCLQISNGKLKQHHTIKKKRHHITDNFFIGDPTLCSHTLIMCVTDFM